MDMSNVGEVGYDNDAAIIEIIDMERESMEGKITPIISAKTKLVVLWELYWWVGWYSGKRKVITAVVL